jgi:hypothetical protein
MSIDIMKIENNKPINDKSAICSTLPTGGYSKLIVRRNLPLDLTIENIESKYDDKFDDIVYYFDNPPT